MKSHQNVVVGGGIDALMTAYMLKLKAPHSEVKIITKNADPRIVDRTDLGFYVDSEEKQLDGSTWNGLINRYITLFEGHNYTGNTATYPEMDFMFQNRITEGGWLGKDFSDLNLEEIQWLAKRVTACCEENAAFNSSLFEFYVNYNRFAMNWWQVIRESEPELFADVDLTTGVARVYDNKELFEAAKVLHEKYDGLAQNNPALSADDPRDLEKIKLLYPHFYKAIQSGYIRGGVLLMDEEKSFTLNIQKFGEKLLTYFEQQGVEVQFCTQIDEIEMDGSGNVVALHGKTLLDGNEYCVTGKNIVVSTGAYAGKLLKGTAAENEVNGVAGGWVVLPAPEGIEQSFKVHGDRYYVCEDGEILKYNDLTDEERSKLPRNTLRDVADQNHKTIDRNGELYIVIGAGYAWVGDDPHSISEAQKRTMQEENLRVARAVYGEHFDKAMQAGEIECRENLCVRSFTSNDVPLFAVGKTMAGGTFVINGGMNTGTTTAATTTANIIADILYKKDGSSKYIEMVSAARDNQQYSASELFQEIHKMNNQWDQFIAEGSGKEILERNKSRIEAMSRLI